MNIFVQKNRTLLFRTAPSSASTIFSHIFVPFDAAAESSTRDAVVGWDGRLWYSHIFMCTLAKRNHLRRNEQRQKESESEDNDRLTHRQSLHFLDCSSKYRYLHSSRSFSSHCIWTHYLKCCDASTNSPNGIHKIADYEYISWEWPQKKTLHSFFFFFSLFSLFGTKITLAHIWDIYTFIFGRMNHPETVKQQQQQHHLYTQTHASRLHCKIYELHFFSLLCLPTPMAAENFSSPQITELAKMNRIEHLLSHSCLLMNRRHRIFFISPEFYHSLLRHNFAYLCATQNDTQFPGSERLTGIFIWRNSHEDAGYINSTLSLSLSLANLQW